MAEAFTLTMPIWQILARTSVVYLAIVVLIRLVPKRRSGSISPNDMIALVLVGALAGDAVMGGSNSIADILLMIAVVVGWGYLFDVLDYHSPLVHRLLREPETALVRDGQILRKNLRREFVTEEELMAALREEGVEDLSMVRTACLEADGQISVVMREEQNNTSVQTK